MMDIKIIFLHIRARGAGVIHSEKLENHKNSAYIKIKFYIIFTDFFSMMNIRFLPWVDGIYVFDILLNYFINVIIKTLYISSCIVVCYILLILLCFDVFFPSPEKLTFGCTKWIFSHSFWPRWLKHASFCREFNCLYIKASKKTIVWKCKIFKKQN